MTPSPKKTQALATGTRASKSTFDEYARSLSRPNESSVTQDSPGIQELGRKIAADIIGRLKARN